MNLTPIKLLLVEDNPADALLLRYTLSEKKDTNLEVEHVTRLNDAIEKLKNAKYDLVILDMSLPDCKGLDCITKLRGLDPYQAIIVLTGFDDDALAVASVNRGAQDYLIKGSFDGHLLYRSITYAIERSQLLKRIEQSSEDRFRKIIDSSLDGMIIASSEGMIKFVNPAAEKIFQKDKESLLGNPFEYSLKAGNFSPVTLHRKNGEDILVEMRITDIEWEKMSAYLISIRDITELQRIENLKAEISERQHLDTLKDNFINTVSHEMRTPLTIIKGAVANLQDGVAGPLNERQGKVIETARRNIDRLARIIHDLLNLARLESGKAVPSFQEVDLNLLVQETLEHFKISAEKTEKSITTDLWPGKLIICADVEMVITVLNNLLDNARRYARQSIKIYTEPVELIDPDEGIVMNNLKASSSQYTYPYVRFSIRDDGPGISEDNLKRLFNKFEQINRTQGGAGYQGTGLGLSICREVMELHGGRIWPESEAGKYCAFHAIFPVSPPELLAHTKA